MSVDGSVGLGMGVVELVGLDVGAGLGVIGLEGLDVGMGMGLGVVVSCAGVIA
jgi:hypothetical protein